MIWPNKLLIKHIQIYNQVCGTKNILEKAILAFSNDTIDEINDYIFKKIEGTLTKQHRSSNETHIAIDKITK